MKKTTAILLAILTLLPCICIQASAELPEATPHWAAADIAFIADKGMTWASLSLDPDEPIDRGEFLSLMLNAAIAPGAAGFKNGLYGLMFAGEQPIYRLEAANILTTALKYKDDADDGFLYIDENQYRYPSVYAVRAAGVMHGYPDSTFGGSSKLTVGEAAAIMRRVYEKSEQEEQGMEIERKFLIDPNNIPFDLSKADKFDIIQTYISISPEVRVRKINGAYYSFAVKAPKDAVGLVRQELEFNIRADEYERLYARREVESIAKTRYQFYIGEEYVAVDIYSGTLEGLAVAEIEFDTAEIANAFEPYDWFIKDVTDDKRYKNAGLAKDGMPKD